MDLEGEFKKISRVASFGNIRDLPSHVNMSGKLEIQWSPIPNRFITWGSDVTLYEVQPLRDSYTQVSGVTKISNKSCAHIIATNPNHLYVKSIDIYPKPHSDVLMAIGISNGKVLLSTFGPSEYDLYGYPGKELVPRHGRQCNVVSFNPNEPNLIAAGLDKHRQDNSVLIWDISKLAHEPNSSKIAFHPVSSDYVRPVAEFGNAEFAHSLSWFRTNSKLIACGMNLKHLRIYDIRDHSKNVVSTPTKAVYGVCLNPRDDRQIASFFDNQISVWDTRNFEKPVLVITPLKPIVKIAWCPTKINMVAAVQKESSVVNLYDIQQTTVSNEDVEPVILERVVTPGSYHNIASISWHPTDENRFLSIASNGVISDYTVYDRITLNWSPISNVMWTYGRKALKYVKEFEIDDISYKIRQRAKNNYELEDQLDKNDLAIDNNDMLASVWNWLHLSNKLAEDGAIRRTNIKHPGVQTILKIDPENNKSETVIESWIDLGNPNCKGSAKYYKHEDREQAIRLCGWPVDFLPEYLKSLEKENEFTRAAAISVFNLKIKAAIELLTRVPDASEYSSSLNIVAMALAGFSDDKSSVWKQFCTNSRSKITDPYLKAMFAFLTDENNNYDDILNERGMSVGDRVAFACMFLPDNKLLEYLQSTTEKLTEEGNLDGLLLTGNDTEGLILLQKYLDTTADIQSTALIAMRAFYTELGNETVKLWIESYRNLLDTWKLWHERAQFDIKLALFRPQEKPPQQVFVSCNFCGKSISAYLHGLNRGRTPFRLGSTTGNTVKISSCPNCRKPLPRCAICLMYMGTTTGEIEKSKMVDFDSWFTWCQTCRHGGHAEHMLQWFKEHQDCPVTGCSCRCYAIDAGNT
ncbi:unnamed protein product [Brassicogethes aeneus]|uniref:WD repeat protein mio zinc-ribbon like domain-containing protein n=1 Tax=Brassicogethes aeneus TaxID=1431903 RepID=A0A9P0B1X7_BRAAE|nr:unnamed protein product [Brassicogethes aeneus]